MCSPEIMADSGMDELDKMMAELAAKPVAAAPKAAPAASKPAKKPAKKIIDGFDASGSVMNGLLPCRSAAASCAAPADHLRYTGQLVLDDDQTLPPRAHEFVNRLKTFQMRVADPCTKERLNKQLAASRYVPRRPSRCCVHALVRHMHLVGDNERCVQRGLPRHRGLLRAARGPRKLHGQHGAVANELLSRPSLRRRPSHPH